MTTTAPQWNTKGYNPHTTQMFAREILEPLTAAIPYAQIKAYETTLRAINYGDNDAQTKTQKHIVTQQMTKLAQYKSLSYWINSEDILTDVLDDITLLSAQDDIILSPTAEDRLIQLSQTYTTAMTIKTDDYDTIDQLETLTRIFGERILDWIINPTILETYSHYERTQIVRIYEQMYYTVVNVRNELAYDIQSFFSDEWPFEPRL
jgi:hypothetical protein